MTILENAQITEREEMLSMLSDMHKDAYGCRPRGLYAHLNIQEMDEVMESLQDVIGNNIVDEEIQLQADLVAFNELLEKTINLGAGNRETALRWLYDGSGIGEINSSQDLEHFAYQQGILFSNEGKALVQELIEIYNN